MIYNGTSGGAINLKYTYLPMQSNVIFCCWEMLFLVTYLAFGVESLVTFSEVT